jgi:hypothetical protein
MAAIRPNRGARVRPRKYLAERQPELTGRVGTVLRAHRTPYIPVPVRWDGLGGEVREYPACGLRYARGVG